MERSGAITVAASQSGHFQNRQMTKKAMMVVTTIVPVTAMP